MIQNLLSGLMDVSVTAIQCKHLGKGDFEDKTSPEAQKANETT